MAAVYQSICNEADLLFLQCVKLINKYLYFKVEIESLMEKGFIDLAKARFIMGSTCVTKMQLPTQSSNPIQPLATVTRKKENGSWIFSIDRKDISSKINLHDMSGDYVEYLNDDGKNIIRHGDGKDIIRHGDGKDINNHIFKNILKNNPKTLKKTKDVFLVDDIDYKEYNCELMDELSSDSSESLVSMTDPIRLFGILVPGSLKQAQVFFKKAVDLIGECITYQNKCLDALQEFNHLMKVKKLIEIAASEIRMDIHKPKVYWTPSETSSVSSISVHTTSSKDEDEFAEVKEPSDNINKVNVQKSIRSVFYDAPQENELPLWSVEKLHGRSGD